MATVKAIWQQMRSVQEQVAYRLGVDLAHAEKTGRVYALSGLAIDAVIVKALLDKGVLTAADLTSALASGQADPWDDEPVQLP